MLYGFSGVILQGAIVTLELAISSVVLAVLIGLVGAAAKLSQSRAMGLIFEGYTTLIRGVPDWSYAAHLLRITNRAEYHYRCHRYRQIDIDPMVAGIITLGFIYGAYFTETFAVRLWLYQKAILKPRRRLALPAHKYFVALCSRR
ncbi:hypothetical protein ACNKHK_15205 [Shigella flexneri]